MRIRPSLILTLLFALSTVAFAAAKPMSPEESALLTNSLTTGSGLFFDTEPPFGQLTAAAAPRGTRIRATLRSSGGYILKLSGKQDKDIVRLEFSLKRADGKKFKTITYGVQVDTKAVPTLNKAQFYFEGGSRVSASRHIPVICLKDDDANAQIVLGFANQVDPAEVRQAGDRLRMARPAGWESITAKEIEDGVYLDLSKQYWFDALKSYAKFADDYRHFKPRPVPAQAYEPVWCSWYTLTTNVNQAVIWENAKIAKSVGIGTLLVDCGWDAPGDPLKRPNRTYGDRVAYRGKFPDMAGMVDRIHKELGMAVELWAAPWHVQKGARAAREVGDVMDYAKDPPAEWLCPRCAKTGDWLARNLSDCMRSYHIDGMWWDFLDSTPLSDCKGEERGIHKHDYQTQGEGYNAAMTKVMNAIHQVNPNALIEIRLGSSNINNKLFANVMETYDTPLSPHDNRGMLVYVRAFSDGVVPKTDPTMWQRTNEEGVKEAPNELVGQYMATMITAGVPSISQNMAKMGESNRRVVKAYLGFYHAHMMDMMKGDFRPVGNGENSPNLVIQGKNATYLYSATNAMPKVQLKTRPKVVYIFSACDKPGVKLDINGLRPGTYTWQAKNPFLEMTSIGVLEIGEAGLSWNAPVPSGGMVELRIEG